MSTTIKSIQTAVGSTADGIWGPNTLKAVATALGCDNTAKAVQTAVGVTADGIIGNISLAAIAAALNVTVSTFSITALKAELMGTNSAPTTAQVRSGSSIYGAEADESNLTNIIPPYPLYFGGTKVSSVRCHKAISAQLATIFDEVLAYYGQAEITRLGLDVYDGSYYARSVVGGSTASMHSWGIAFDFNAAKNGMYVKSPTALFSGEEYAEFIRIWYKNGARSFGLENDYDYMHFEFAKSS